MLMDYSLEAADCCWNRSERERESCRVVDESEIKLVGHWN
jgi:hypothetical protein